MPIVVHVVSKTDWPAILFGGVIGGVLGVAGAVFAAWRLNEATRGESTRQLAAAETARKDAETAAIAERERKEAIDRAERALGFLLQADDALRDANLKDPDSLETSLRAVRRHFYLLFMLLSPRDYQTKGEIGRALVLLMKLPFEKETAGTEYGRRLNGAHAAASRASRLLVRELTSILGGEANPVIEELNEQRAHEQRVHEDDEADNRD